MGIVRAKKITNEIRKGDARTFRNCDIASCEIQTEDMGSLLNRASLKHEVDFTQLLFTFVTAITQKEATF